MVVAASVSIADSVLDATITKSNTTPAKLRSSNAFREENPNMVCGCGGDVLEAALFVLLRPEAGRRRSILPLFGTRPLPLPTWSPLVSSIKLASSMSSGGSI